MQNAGFIAQSAQDACTLGLAICEALFYVTSVFPPGFRHKAVAQQAVAVRTHIVVSAAVCARADDRPCPPFIRAIKPVIAVGQPAQCCA